MSSDHHSLMSVEYLCKLLNVKPSWVYDAVEAGTIPHFKLGRRTLRFDRFDVQQWLASRSHGER